MEFLSFRNYHVTDLIAIIFKKAGAKQRHRFFFNTVPFPVAVFWISSKNNCELLRNKELIYNITKMSQTDQSVAYC